MICPSSDLKQSKSAYLGLDVGAASMVIVLIDGHGDILGSDYTLISEQNNFKQDAKYRQCSKSCETCHHPCDSEFIIRQVHQFISSHCNELGVDIFCFGATGSQVHQDMAFDPPLDLLVSEVSAHARGMQRASNTKGIQAIIDVGGQDAKVIRLSHPLDFYMSGLCAAGTGAYLDEISRIENISVAEFGRIGGGYLEKYLQMLPSEDPLPMEEFSSVCTVFAKSSYIKKKALLSLEERAAAICWAQGKQIYNSMIQSLRDYTGSISFQGGVSFNHGVRLSLNHLLKQGRDASSGAEQVLIIPQIDDYRDAEGNKKQVSHLMGALGAAFLGKEHVELRKGVINPNFAKSIESRRDRVL